MYLVRGELAVALINGAISFSCCHGCMQDRLEVQRLNAARVALERRLSQLDASTDRRAGILSPFVPENERPWRDRIESNSLKQAIEEINLKTDPTADMSMQWDLEPNEETLKELKQEIVSFASYLVMSDILKSA